MMNQSLFGRVLALLLALTLILPSTAFAEDAAAAAADYYNQATTAYQAGDYQKAADLLDLAFGKNPDLVYKYNRILALQAFGDYDTALADLNAMYSPMKADGQNRFEDIDQVKEQLESAIAARDAAATPEDGQTGDPTGTDPIEDPDPAPKDSKGINPLGVALLAGGGTVLLTGVLFSTGLFIPGDVKDCIGFGGEPSDCSERTEPGENPIEVFEDARSVQTTHQIVSVALMGAGAVAAAIGVVVLVMDGQDDEQQAGLDSLRFSPYVSHDGGGAAFQLRF